MARNENFTKDEWLVVERIVGNWTKTTYEDLK